MASLGKKLAVLWNALLSPDEQKRYDSRYLVLSKIAHTFGFRLYNRNLMWMQDEEFIKCWSEFTGQDESTGKLNDRKFVLYSMAKSVANLDGDSVECGVFDGGSSFLIYKAMQGRDNYQHHAFDSYEGLSEPGDLDQVEDSRAWQWQENDLSVPLAKVKENLQDCLSTCYYQGWIPERFDDIADKQFSFVHIDVDLFQPTYDSIAFFYERIVSGGIMLCDDYGFSTCPGAYKAMNQFFAKRPECVVHLPTGQGYIIKR